MKITCDIIKDLMPSYIDSLCSDDSSSLIKEHIQTCEKCKASLDSMQNTTLHIQMEEGELVQAQRPFAIIKRKNRVLIFLAVLISVTFMGAAMFAVNHVQSLNEIFFPQQIVTINTYEMKWEQLSFGDTKYLIYDSFFYQKKITNDANSNSSIKLRVLDEAGKSVLLETTLNAGTSCDLKELKRNEKYIVEVWHEEGFYLLRFY